MSEEVGSLRVNLSLDTAEFTQRIQDINRKLRAVQSEFRAASDGTRSYATSIQGLSAKSDALTRQLEIHRAKVQSLRQQYEEVSSAQGANSRAAEELLIRYNRAQGTLNRTEASLSRTQQELARLTQEAERNSTVWGRLQNNMNQISDRMGTFGNRMKTAGTSIATSFGAAAAGIGIALGSAVKKSADFESQMSKVGAISGATGDDLNKLRDSALKLGASTSLSASQVADAMTEMAKKGYKTNEIIAAMPGVISAAEASGEDLSVVADTISSAINTFGLSADKSTHVADVLAQAANDSAAGITDMQYAFNYAAAPAHALGMSLETLSASTEIMADSGIKGEQAGTTLRSALLRLADPPKAAANELNQLGVKITDSHGKMLPFSNIIGQLGDKTKGMANAQKTAALSTIFGKEAVSGMLAVVNAGPEKIDKMTNSLKKSDGASADAAKKMKQNLKGALQELQGSFETAAITIGTALTPAIEKISGKIQELIQWFNNLSPHTQKLIANGALISAAVLGVVTVLGGAAVAIGGLSIAIGAISAPVAIVVAAIAALVAGGIALYANWDKIMKMSPLLKGAILALSPGLTLIVGAIKGVQYAMSDAIPKANLFGDNISKGTQKAVGSFLDLNKKATEQLHQLEWGGDAVTKSTANKIISNFDQMGQQMLAGLKKHHGEELSTMQQFFANSTLLNDKDKKDTINKMNEKYNQQSNAVKNGETIIKGILDKASKEKRSLTEDEKIQINNIQEGMVTNGIQYLSKNELESKSIMERMKAQAGEITAQQAADVVKNSKKQTDQAVKAANDQYDKTVKEIIRQRDEVGSISAEQANKMILDAKLQRDKVVGHAKDMQSNVVAAAKKQAGDHADQVNWESGEVLSKWEMMKKNTSKKISEMAHVISIVWDQVKKDTSKKWDEIKAWPGKKVDEMIKFLVPKIVKVTKTVSDGWNKAEKFLSSIDLKEIGKNIIQGLIKGIESKATSVVNSVKSLADSIPTWLKKVLDINSPSRVMEKLGGFPLIGSTDDTRQNSQNALKFMENAKGLRFV